MTLVTALCQTFQLIEGESTIAAAFIDQASIAVGTNTGSFYAAEGDQGRALSFLSEEAMMRRLTNPDSPVHAFSGAEIRRLPAGQGALIAIAGPRFVPFPMNGQYSPQVSSTLALARRIESLEHRLAERRKTMLRCARCIMPETVPFIKYGQDGVCNYCNNYNSRPVKGRNALGKELAEFRSENGHPDCLVAFSGGRDSSYGLHILRTEFGMNPIAYTYDWGMVTDIARRNQARLCGKLGIEHVWVSADIQAKRRNIRKNVEAWLKRPHLGMIPHFHGRRQAFFLVRE